MFPVFTTHNSKIRELSNGNKYMVVPIGLLAMGPTIFELWVMETEIWVMKIDEPNTPLTPKSVVFKDSKTVNLGFHLTLAIQSQATHNNN